MSAMQNKGYSKESAGNICGKMEQQTRGAAIIPKEGFSSWQHCQDAIGPHYDQQTTDKICGHLKSIGQASVKELAAMTWDECIAEATRKGANDPQALCGWLRWHGPNAQGSVKTADSKFFVKAFLLDASLNINKWRVHPDSIDRNINTFIGKPLVLTESFDHPSPADGQPESLNHWLSYQETFRVGTIIDVTTKPNPLTGNQAYYAVIEVTNDHLRQALTDNKVPLYVSPAIAELVVSPTKAAAVLPDGSELVENWVGVHLAIVSEPAFGVKKAVISETCGGDEKGCLLQLRRASIAKHGATNCGFCIRKALQKYEILARLASKKPGAAQPKPTARTSTSHAFTNGDQARRNYRLSALEPNDPQVPTDQTAQQNQPVQEKPVEVVEQRSIPLQHQPVKQPVQSMMTLADAMSKIQQLEQTIQLKDLKLEELSGVNETFGQRVAALEMERRKEKIERIITSDVIKDQKARLEKINQLTASSIPIEEIEVLYRDVKVALRKASAVQPRGRVPYLGASLGSGGVASSGNQNQSVIVDEETGLTPLQKQLAVLRGGP